jgi:hypothetical protein
MAGAVTWGAGHTMPEVQETVQDLVVMKEGQKKSEANSENWLLICSVATIDSLAEAVK